MSASKILLFFCLFFVGGIFAASFFEAFSAVLLAAASFGVFLISVFWRKKKLVIAGFCVLFLIGGVWRYQLAELNFAKNEVRRHNDTGEIIVLTGVVAKEPDIRERSQRLTIRIEFAEVQPRQIPHSYVLLTTWRYPEYKYGDKLRIEGKLESPPILGDFNYANYLKKDGIYSQLSFPKIEVVSENQGIFFFAKILQFKEKLRASLYRNLSPPQSSILGAIILGDKRQLSDDIKTKLNIAGVRHITAVSGLHVTVLSAMMMSFLLWLGFWRQQAFWLSIVLITLFIVMTGLQPSAIRAGIMGGLFLTAQYLGRQNASSRAIVTAGAIMLLHNPYLLRLDLGFQLSFLAMFGIVHLLPIFRDWLNFVPWENPRSILAMTFSAYFWTLPILIYNFGLVSLIAPIANLLIIPFLYLIMLFGFLFGLAGIIFQPLGWILSWPSFLLLTYLTTTVDLFSKLPLAYFTFENVHWLWVLISYAFLAFATYKLKERVRLRFLNY